MSRARSARPKISTGHEPYRMPGSVSSEVPNGIQLSRAWLICAVTERPPRPSTVVALFRETSQHLRTVLQRPSYSRQNSEKDSKSSGASQTSAI